ncbi:MAG: hypothetical protein ACRDOH_20805 [Streptosporangiaceae bacterium]
MRLQILQVPDCPNAVAPTTLLTALVHGGTRIEQLVIHDQHEAAEQGMRGSPTLLIDGTDPFTLAGQPAGLSCRLYRHETGALAGTPSPAQLRRALTQKGRDDA